MADGAAQQFAKLPSSSKILLLALLLALMGVGYYTSFHTPLSDEITAAENRRRQLEDELGQAKELERKFLALRQELEQRKLAETEYARILPPSAEMATMLADLNRLAELSGLTIRVVEPKPEVPADYYVRIPVFLGVSGRYHQLAKFFYNVSRLSRAINIENISIQEPKLSGDELIMQVTVQATTFRRKDA
jgi:type IV pilus assembly protein PilO